MYAYAKQEFHYLHKFLINPLSAKFNTLTAILKTNGQVGDTNVTFGNFI